MEIFNTFVNQLDDEELSVGYFQQDGATSHTKHQSSVNEEVLHVSRWDFHLPKYGNFEN